jgi:hypothetical protein
MKMFVSALDAEGGEASYVDAGHSEKGVFLVGSAERRVLCSSELLQAVRL